MFWALKCQESKLHPQPFVVFQEGKDSVMGTREADLLVPICKDKSGHALIICILFLSPVEAQVSQC